MKLKKISKINGVVSFYESDNEQEIKFLTSNGWVADSGNMPKAEPKQEPKEEPKVEAKSEKERLKDICDELGIKYSKQAGVNELSQLIEEHQEEEKELDIDL